MFPKEKENKIKKDELFTKVKISRHRFEGEKLLQKSK